MYNDIVVSWYHVWCSIMYDVASCILMYHHVSPSILIIIIIIIMMNWSYHPLDLGSNLPMGKKPQTHGILKGGAVPKKGQQNPRIFPILERMHGTYILIMQFFFKKYSDWNSQTWIFGITPMKMNKPLLQARVTSLLKSLQLRHHKQHLHEKNQWRLNDVSNNPPGN